MSLRFVTRKLKTQTLGDDDGGVETNNGAAAASLNTPDSSNQQTDKNMVSPNSLRLLHAAIQPTKYITCVFV